MENDIAIYVYIVDFHHILNVEIGVSIEGITAILNEY